VTDLPDGDELPILELGGGWRAELLTTDQWREAVSSGPLHRFADFDPRTPLVYVMSKVTPNTQSGEDGSGDQGTFVAPCGVPEDSHEALYVALINAQAHEALEWVQIDGKPYFDPHTEVGDYVLEGTLTRWLEWKTGKRVVLEEFD
jgi:hypothetical protein